MSAEFRGAKDLLLFFHWGAGVYRKLNTLMRSKALVRRTVRRCKKIGPWLSVEEVGMISNGQHRCSRICCCQHQVEHAMASNLTCYQSL